MNHPRQPGFIPMSQTNPGSSGRPMMNVPGLYHQATDNQHGPVPLGQQQAAAWAAGEGGFKPILTVEPAASLWRVSVFGDLLLRVQWGTSSTNTVENIAAPLIAAFPGRVTVEGQPRDVQTATIASCTLTPATAGGFGSFKQFQTAAGPISPFAVRATAITAANLTIQGQAVALAVGDSIPLTSNSALVAGVIIADLLP